MKLHDLRPAAGSRRKRTRVGRGIAAGQGKTAGRGTKGQKSRAGAAIPAWFEGGQTPIHIRVPKLRGFKNRFRIGYEVVNVGQISDYAEAGRFGAESRRQVDRRTVNAELLASAGLIGGREAGQGARPGRRCAPSSSSPPTRSAPGRGARSRPPAVSSRSSHPRRRAEGRRGRGPTDRRAARRRQRRQAPAPKRLPKPSSRRSRESAASRSDERLRASEAWQTEYRPRGTRRPRSSRRLTRTRLSSRCSASAAAAPR